VGAKGHFTFWRYNQETGDIGNMEVLMSQYP
jgi:hypothetical protein